MKSIFNDETGYPILVNTSLNGGGEPIIDSAEDAIIFFRHNDEVDLLLLGDRLISRNKTNWLRIFKAGHTIKLSDGTLTNVVFSKGQRYVFFIKGRLSASVSVSVSVSVSLDIFDSINKNGGSLSYDLLENNSNSVIKSLFTAMMLGLMEFES
ncbi:carbamoyltransferase C-terminal domain-containing protein [Serratia quinivorans]|uniref:carbamoyltransferase C-terminal domain-containing protein n=1 Tax=Serratia quinivorans TaxID=137545 RepID=UPI0034C5BB80